MKGNWLKWTGLLALLGIAAITLWPVSRQDIPENRGTTMCQSNLKQIGLGFKQYIQDSDEKYPLVAFGGATFGWADAIQPYLKSTQLYQCPAETHSGSANPRQNHYTDYWFNSRVAGFKEEKLEEFSSTFLCGDGSDGHDATNARYNISDLPLAWRSDEKSPAFRHLRGAHSDVHGANYLFADGHVKWLAAESVSTTAPGNNYTFAVS